MALVTTIGIVGCSNGDGRKGSPEPAAIGTGGAASNDVKDDREFVHDIAIMNQAEVELSRLALEKATSPDIKAFAQLLIEEHDAAGNKLKAAVSGQPVQWPTQLDDSHRETAGELATRHGTEFDREYLEAMVESHQNFAARLESRLDVQSVADWKTAAAGRTQSHALPDPRAELHDVTVRPARSDSAVTMKVNQWAAETYPLAQKHLDTARALEIEIKKRSTN